MPYIHKKCKGEIVWHPPWPIPPRCKKCGHRWSPLVLYGLPPKDMVFLPPDKKEEKYASWAQKVPFVTYVAMRLPHWPKWARILSFCIIVVLIGFVVYWFLIRGGL